MILVSFFSEDKVLSDEIKICYIFEFQSNEIRASRFLLLGSPGIEYMENYCFIKPGVSHSGSFLAL